MRVILLFMTLAHMTNPMAKSIEVIQHLNYGVIFDKIGILNNAEQKWTHTIHIPLPTNDWPKIPPPFCQNSSLPCGTTWKLWSKVDLIRQDIMTQVTNITEEIKNIVPEYRIAAKGRSHRAILGFVGSLSKSIFGTATMKDVNILKEHMNEIITENSRLTHAFENHANGMSSYMSLINKRLDNAFSAINANHNSMTQMAKGLYGTMQDAHDRLISITNVLLSYSRAADQVPDNCNSFRTVCMLFFNGRLSPKLVPFPFLAYVLL